NPSNPFTQPQINRIAQVLELTSRVGNFPLQLTSSPSGEGLGWHGMGGEAWGGHLNCPGNVRRGQCPGILEVARAIRAGTPEPSVKSWTTRGQLSFADLARTQLHEQPSTVLQVTAENSPNGAFAANLAAYVNDVFAADTVLCPKDVSWFYAVPGKGPGQWRSEGMLSLSGLAAQLGTTVASMLALTARRSPGGRFPAANAEYVNGVIARASGVKAPAGVVLHY